MSGGSAEPSSCRGRPTPELVTVSGAARIGNADPSVAQAVQELLADGIEMGRQMDELVVAFQPSLSQPVFVSI